VGTQVGGGGGNLGVVVSVGLDGIREEIDQKIEPERVGGGREGYGGGVQKRQKGYREKSKKKSRIRVSQPDGGGGGKRVGLCPQG